MTSIDKIAEIIARRVPGPFRESGGLPGERAAMRYNTAARYYMHARRVRGMGARAALALAAPIALRPHTYRSPQWYGNRGGAGRPYTQGRDVMRWIESTADSGFRFVGYADEIGGRGISHRGWYSDSHCYETLRGAVWQLPGRAGHARLVYGYIEQEGRREMNPGSAALCVSDIVESLADDSWGGITEADESRDCAAWADSLAEHAAEARREYDESYQEGRKAAEHDEAALSTAGELLPLLGELRTHRKGDKAGSSPAICSALRATVDSLLGEIKAAREQRDSLWADVEHIGEPRNAWRAHLLDAWRAGFIDESGGGFVRAVRLGYASAADWQGPPESNPCGAGA